jgi:hypothetical protein
LTNSFADSSSSTHTVTPSWNVQHMWWLYNFTKHSWWYVVDLWTAWTWDEQYLWHPHVIKENDGTYKMWYWWYANAHRQIGYATSTDWISWTKYAGNPIITIWTNWTWDDTHAIVSSIVKESDTLYKMWYTWHDWARRKIWYATSSDWINWTKYASNPILTVWWAGTWDSNIVTHGNVIKESDWTYKMWYSWNDWTTRELWYATSTDWISWTKYAWNPILHQPHAWTLDNNWLLNSEIYKDEKGNYIMLYAWRNWDNWRILRSSSSDWVNWTWGDLVIDLWSNWTWDDYSIFPAMIMKDDDSILKSWYIWFDWTDQRLWLAKAIWGKFWTTSMYFDWSGDYLSVTDHEDFNFTDGDFTIDFWVNPASITWYHTLFWKEASGWYDPYLMQIDPSGNVYWNISYSWTAWNVSRADCWTVSVWEWTHIAMVRSWSNLYLFNNWNLTSTTDIGNATIYPNTWDNFMIWSREPSTTQNFNWYIDEFRVLKWKAKWTSNFTPPISAY